MWCHALSQNSGTGVTQQGSGLPGCLQQVGALRLLPLEHMHTGQGLHGLGSQHIGVSMHLTVQQIKLGGIEF